MTCSETKSLLSEYLDSSLEISVSHKLKEHLDLCPACRRELELLRGVGQLLRDIPRQPLPDGFLARLEARRQASQPRTLTIILAPRTLALALGSLFLGVALYKTSRPPLILQPKNLPLAALPSSRFSPHKPSGFESSIQIKTIQEESERLGLAAVGRETEPPASSPFLGPRLGLHSVRANAEASLRQLVALRHSIEESSGKPKAVAIEGKMAPVLSVVDQNNGTAIAENPGLWRGDFSGGNEGARAITDFASWKQLWASLLPQAPLPAIDFSRQEVVAIFSGQRPSGGYSLEILSAAPEASALIIRYRERLPPPGIPPPEGATTPYILRVVPKNDLPVRFEKIP